MGIVADLIALVRRHVMRLGRFALVGLSGLVVNTVALAVVSGGLGFHYLIGVLASTQVSSAWNYALTERYVFTGDDRAMGGAQRFVRFWAVNMTALALRGPLLVLLIDGLGIHYLVSNVVTLGAVMVGRYWFSANHIWQEPAATFSVQMTPVHIPGTLGGRHWAVTPIRPMAAPTTSTAFVDGDLGVESVGSVTAVALAERPAPTVARHGGGHVHRYRPPGRFVDPAARHGSVDGAGGPAPSDREPVPRLPWPQRLRAGTRRPGTWVAVAAVVTVALPAVFLRVWHVTSLGFNSDEAVYAGQGASISGNETLLEYFPVFRAHPLLFQTTVSLVYQVGWGEVAARLVSVAFGLGTVVVTYLLAEFLYGRRAGFVAALLLAVMPYHVVVTRQVLLDGPMVFFATITLYLLARYAASSRPVWMYSAGAVMGLTFLANERSVVLLGGVYAFFAVSSRPGMKLRHMVVGTVVFAGLAAIYPVSVILSGKEDTGGNFLAWQLFRRANHTWEFYWVEVPPALGWAVVFAAVGGLLAFRAGTWREMMLIAWIVVPVGFFQLWPVKGFQYLLVLAPAFAVLAARTVEHVVAFIDRRWTGREARPRVRWAAVALAVFVVAAPTSAEAWARVNPGNAGQEFLAGSGGVPGGREAGEWVAEHVPEGAVLLAIGPSMANIIQFYGDRKTFGLAVSPNPLHRNPVYEPVINPDHQLRSSELHYLVWDSFSAGRSEFFSQKLLSFAERYHGRIVHEEFVEVAGDDGVVRRTPVVVIYSVRP